MNKSALIAFSCLLLCGFAVSAQTNIPTHWSPVSWHFKVDGVPHVAGIDHNAVMSARTWDPSKPLPLSFESVEIIARKKLQQIVADDGVWKAVGFEVNRLSFPPDSSNWYYTVHFRTTIPRQEGSITNYLDEAEVLVDFNGKPGYFDND